MPGTQTGDGLFEIKRAKYAVVSACYAMSGTGICICDVRYWRSLYAMPGTDIAYGATRTSRGGGQQRLGSLRCTPKSNTRNRISVQIVPGMRFLVFEFAVYQPPRVLGDVRYAHSVSRCLPWCAVGPRACGVQYWHNVSRRAGGPMCSTDITGVPLTAQREPPYLARFDTLSASALAMQCPVSTYAPRYATKSHTLERRYGTSHSARILFTVRGGALADTEWNSGCTADAMSGTELVSDATIGGYPASWTPPPDGSACAAGNIISLEP
eukprot:2440258-Rhodomonas_salina.2